MAILGMVFPGVLFRRVPGRVWGLCMFTPACGLVLGRLNCEPWRRGTGVLFFLRTWCRAGVLRLRGIVGVHRGSVTLRRRTGG